MWSEKNGVSFRNERMDNSSVVRQKKSIMICGAMNEIKKYLFGLGRLSVICYNVGGACARGRRGNRYSQMTEQCPLHVVGTLEQNVIGVLKRRRGGIAKTLNRSNSHKMVPIPEHPLGYGGGIKCVCVDACMNMGIEMDGCLFKGGGKYLVGWAAWADEGWWQSWTPWACGTAVRGKRW